MRGTWIATAFAFLAVFSCAASGAVITFDLSFAYNGGVPPVGTAPWLSAIFDDGGTAGSVTMTLADINLSGGEFVFSWLFNLDPALDPTDLIFSVPPTKTGKFDDPVISLGIDAFQADGDGMFDIELAFANYDGPNARFGRNDAVAYSITGIPTLTASSFNFVSELDGGQGVYPTAAQVGNTGPTGEESVWVAVPEPATLSLLVIGASLLIRRKRT